jgi:hypothetical protein
LEDLPFFLSEIWRGGVNIAKGVYICRGRGVQIQIKTPKYMQKQAEIDENRRKSGYIEVYIQIYSCKSGYISGYGTLLESENRVCDAQ